MSCVQLTAEDGGKGQLELVAERVLVLWIAIVLAPQHEDDCVARCMGTRGECVTSVRQAKGPKAQTTALR